MQFDRAVKAVIAGDIDTLRSLLALAPELAKARSNRPHRATLLHYVGANGVEEENQLSPQNAPDVARLLLRHGVEVDALADIYGGSTALTLVASSRHPQRFGVQIELLETLLTHGASIDGGSGGSPLLAALRNGHRSSAEFLWKRGARMDLEAAAGVGDLGRIRDFFCSDGTLKAPATRAQLDSGFLWACEYDHLDVIEFLLNRGASLISDGGTGLTGLHWAAAGASVKAVRLLLDRGASLEAVNRYGATPLGQAVWSAVQDDVKSGNYLPIVKMLVAAGAKVDGSLVEWLAQLARNSVPPRAATAEALLSVLR